jgi:hypothetical protein
MYVSHPEPPLRSDNLINTCTLTLDLKIKPIHKPVIYLTIGT